MRLRSYNTVAFGLKDCGVRKKDMIERRLGREEKSNRIDENKAIPLEISN